MTCLRWMPLVALIALPAVAAAQPPIEPSHSWATMRNEPGVMLIAPANGESLISPTDYTIDVYLNDSGNNPVEVPNTDIWLDNPATVPCPIAPWISDTGSWCPNCGHDTMTRLLRGGVPYPADCRTTFTEVMCQGYVIQILDLRFVSPDLNGNQSVTLVDFAIFGSYCNVPCSPAVWCADLNKSDEPNPLICVTAADFAIFAGFFMNSNCP
jgi:hypothetical protein